MGFWDKVLGNSNEQRNNELYSFYGKKQTRAYFKEIKNSSRLKFKEVLNINDDIIEKYNKTNKADIQNELLKKYLNISLDDVNKQLIEEQQIKNEIDESLDGVDKKTKEEVKKDVIKDKKENNEKDSKDKKSELQSRIYKAMYNRMYKDYSNKVLQIKDAQFYANDIGMTSKEAVEIISYEKNLEKIELMNYNVTGKTFGKDEKITKQREEFKAKFDYNQKGINNVTNKRVQDLNTLYIIREAKHREYIKALTDLTKSPQEINIYKQEYEEANMNLIQNVPALQEYINELKEHSENEILAQKAGVDEISAINNQFDISKETSEKVTESQTAEYIDATTMKKQEREIKTLEYANAMKEEQLDSKRYGIAKNIIDSTAVKNDYEDSLQRKENVIDANENVNEQQQMEDNDFRKNLRSAVKNNLSYEEAQKEIEKDLQDRSYEENTKAEKQQQEYVIQRKKTSNKN